MNFSSIQKGKLRQIQKSRRLLHQALVSLILEKKYESITVQQILDRAHVGRSTFYLHFKDKDELLSMGFDYLAELLREIQATQRNISDEPSEKLIAFSLPMFMHMYEFRGHSRVFNGTSAGVIVRERIQKMISEIVTEEMDKLSRKGQTANATNATNAGIPRDIFIDHLASTFMLVTTWWLDSEEPVSPETANSIYHSLVVPGLKANFA